MQYGFDLAAISSLQAMPGFLDVFGYVDPSNQTEYATDSTVYQVKMSLLIPVVSSLVTGFFSVYFGRRAALWLACIVNAVTCALQIDTLSHGGLYFGRLLLGFANGFLVAFSNICTLEAAPAHVRGVRVALLSSSVNIECVLTSVEDCNTQTRLDCLS
ncbi:hypothetical protein N7470_004475 [Penicillium chermesinum]|nr:hypothetical protein N7470_004475 [Penicillium chermesinum]